MYLKKYETSFIKLVFILLIYLLKQKTLWDITIQSLQLYRKKILKKV